MHVKRLYYYQTIANRPCYDGRLCEIRANEWFSPRVVLRSTRLCTSPWRHGRYGSELYVPRRCAASERVAFAQVLMLSLRIHTFAALTKRSFAQLWTLTLVRQLWATTVFQKLKVARQKPGAVTVQFETANGSHLDQCNIVSEYPGPERDSIDEPFFSFIGSLSLLDPLATNWHSED